MIFNNHLVLAVLSSLVISGTAFAQESDGGGESNKSSCNGAGKYSDLAKSRLNLAFNSQTSADLSKNLESTKSALVAAYKTAQGSVPSSKSEAKEKKKIMQSSAVVHDSIVDFQETNDAVALEKAARVLSSSKSSKSSKVLDEALLSQALAQRAVLLSSIGSGSGCKNRSGGD